jgi:hypothetical protein
LFHGGKLFKYIRCSEAISFIEVGLKELEGSFESHLHVFQIRRSFASGAAFPEQSFPLGIFEERTECNNFEKRYRKSDFRYIEVIVPMVSVSSAIFMLS